MILVTFSGRRLRLNEWTINLTRQIMCDLAYVNLLRVKVREFEAEEKRTRDFGHSSSGRFVPWTFPAQSAQQTVSQPRA